MVGLTTPKIEWVIMKNARKLRGIQQFTFRRISKFSNQCMKCNKLTPANVQKTRFEGCSAVIKRGWLHVEGMHFVRGMPEMIRAIIKHRKHTEEKNAQTDKNTIDLQ